MLFSLLPAFPASAEEALPTINVNMTLEDHAILHGSAGFLYGISNEGVPDVNTLTPLKPKVLATKGALGTEHPYGDALDVADEFFESGGEQIQMYNSNYYGVFGVTANAYDYGNVLESVIAPYVASWKDTMREKYPDIDSRMVYIPINEGTPVNGVSSFEEAWKIYYNAIKKADPTAVIAGPNDAVYRGHNSMYNFLSYCKNNNCLPDIISWHELQVGCLNTMDDHIADYRNICKSLGIEEKQVVINEYADFSDCGVPGRLVNWIARLEDNEVYGCLPFWHQANNLNDLTANANDGNGAWWVYKWYGDMSGKVLNLSTQNTSFDQFYGLASIDENKKSASVICGGNDGSGIINLNNIDKTGVFKNADYVHVKVEASYFTGYHGASGDPEAVLEGVFPVTDGNVSIQLDDMLFSTAYRITVTPTDETSPYTAKGTYRVAYEAEDASHYGSLITDNESTPLETPRYFCSGRVRIGGINEEREGIGYNISVPHDGLYKLSFIYGNGVGSTRNNAQTHNPKNITQKLVIDGEESILHLPNTLFYSMEGMAEEYVNLTRGNHTINLMYNGDEGAFHDCLYVSYAGAYDEELPIFNRIYQAESADFNPESLSVTESAVPYFTGSGYVTGLNEVLVSDGGGIRQIVRVPESGLYNIAFRYTASDYGNINLYLDNTNLTFSNHLTDIEITPTDSWDVAYTTIFLKKGLNIIDIGTDTDANIDYMAVIASDTDQSVTYEAEDATGNFKTQTSKGVTYTLPLQGGENSRETDYIELSVTADEEGLYKMQVFQSNNELCGTHSYNIKIIDRYASFEVNGDKANARRYFFPNSFSDDTFLERTIPVYLEKGENTIRIYNDDSWHVLWGGSTSEPGTNELINYTPNFDKFIITPAVTSSPLRDTGFKVTLSSTDNGYIYSDKNTAAWGDKVNIYLIPDGNVTTLTLNGEDILPTLKTYDGNIYTTDFTITEDCEIYASFSSFTGDDFTYPENDDYIIIDGKHYRKTGENLFTNGDFSDPSGSGMENWYVGVNKSGHPQTQSYQMPKINPDGSLTNLVPLTQSGYLTTGGYEIDGTDTFYYGRDASSTYLVEHMASNWQNAAWNGNQSLLGFVPIKENTNYIFSYRAYSVSGKASIRYGAIDMDEGDNFYIPSAYSANETLNFTNDNAFTCNNGDMQNVGGAWQDYTLVFNSGEGADYFLFNAYWLQMAEYLCLGDFELYELSGEAFTNINSVTAPKSVVTIKGDELTLPETVTATDENGTTLTLPITWANSQIIDTAVSGVYVITGEIQTPEGYYIADKYIRLRVIVTDNLCEITSWSVENGTATLSINCYETRSATMVTAAYDKDTLISVSLTPITLEKGKAITATTDAADTATKVFIWDTDTLTPLCSEKLLTP